MENKELTREEILAFLNADKGSHADKFFMKMMLWLDCGFYFAIAIFGLLLKAIGFDTINLIINSAFVLQIILFWVWYKFINNISQTYMFAFVTSIMTTLKLVYGYLVFQIQDSREFGSMIFGPFHIIVLIIILALAVYISLRLYKAFKSIESKNKDTSKKTFVIATIACSGISAPLLLHLLGDDIKEQLKILGLGIGFCFWTLACIWLFMVILFIPKLIISQRYKYLIEEKSNDK